MDETPLDTMRRQRRQAEGNMALLVLVDSSQAFTHYSIVEETVLVALEHFGIPYRILDLAKRRLTKEGIGSAAALIIAQEHLGESLSTAETQTIADALAAGQGLVNFDGDLRLYKPPLLAIFGFVVDRLPFASDLLRINRNSHYITWTQEEGSLKRLRRPITFYQVTDFRGEATVLAEALLGKEQLVLSRHLVPGNAYEPGRYPVAFATTYGEGRAVQFACSPRLWLSEVFGHARGLDGLFWRSIVWAVKKPFLMQALPPFVTFRIDDVTGRSGMRYLDILNEHGYRPLVGLLLEEIHKELIPFMRAKYEARGADFDTHALGYYRLLGFDFGVGEYSEEELEKIFDRADDFYRHWDMEPPKTYCPHWGEVGVRALPFLKARGRTFLNTPYHPGQLKWARLQSPGWWPYGLHGFFYDYLPEDSDIYNINCMMVGEATPPDFLTGCTVWLDENPFNDLEAAAKNGATQIRLGLDGLFFSGIVTHEQKLEVLSPEEIDRILTLIEAMTTRYEKIFATYDQVAEYAKSKDRSWVAKAEYDQKAEKVDLTLLGESSLPLKLYLFQNEGEGVTYRFQEVPPFRGRISQAFSATP